MSDSDASDEVDVSVRLHEMHLRHNSSNVTSESCQDLNSAEIEISLAELVLCIFVVITSPV